MMTPAPPDIPRSKLAYVPPTFFGAVMGISGLGLAWRQAELALGWPALPGDIVLIVGAIVLSVVAAAYALKCLLHTDMLWQDFAHPVKGPFLAGAPLAFLLQVPALSPVYAPAAHTVYFFGAALSLFLTLYIFSRWYLRPQELNQMNAIWLIPGVGSFLAALTGVPLGYTELSWFFFAVGVVIWMFLSSVLLFRLMFGPAYPTPLLPSYLVPIVPPGLMSMIYPLLVPGPVQPFTKVVYFFALFLTLFNASMIRVFLRVRFSMGWWAYSFPLDTIAAATLIYGDATNNPYLLGVGQALLALATGLIAFILCRTLIEVFAGRVLIPDPPPAQTPVQP